MQAVRGLIRLLWWGLWAIWLWGSTGGGLLPGGGGPRLGVQGGVLPEGLTTEATLYLGPTSPPPPPPPPPPADFSLLNDVAFASYVTFTISYNATYNFTKVVLWYTEKADKSYHSITLNVNLTTGVFGEDFYSNNHLRRGFRYRMGGMFRRSRYFVCATGYMVGPEKKTLKDCVSFLTGEHDGEPGLYNMTGIILVLGISTIIMVFIMFCIGYEKLIVQRGQLCKGACCELMKRKRKKRKKQSSISPEPLTVQETHKLMAHNDSSSGDSIRF